MEQAKVPIDPNDPKNWRLRTSPIFKLKDKQNRNFIVIHLKDFGFLPETIIVEKVPGQNNRMRISAVLTSEEVDKQNKKTLEIIEKRKEEIKK